MVALLVAAIADLTHLGQWIELVMFLPWIIYAGLLCAARIRDIVWNKWSLVLLFVPFVGWVVWIMLFVIPGRTIEKPLAIFD